MVNESKIREEALRLRYQSVGRHSADPTPVVEVARSLGYQVNEFSPTSETRQISGAVDHDKKVVFVNAKEGPGRKRFTIAHEIGHIVLHADDGNFVDYRHDGDYADEDRPKEREANLFAANLLMPQGVFESLWQAFDADLKSVAQRLQVSHEAASYRARSLGLT